MTARWCRVRIPVVQRTLYDASAPIPSHPAPPGATIVHWADLELAAAWFAYARSLATDQARIARLDAMGGPGDNGGWVEQATYIGAIVDALANGYNALDIPWYTDPQARGLYRTFIAGEPSVPGTQQSDAPFATDRPYSPDWYDANETMPTSHSPAPGGFTGVIPRAAQQAFRRVAPLLASANNKFRQRAGLFVDYTESTNLDPRGVRIDAAAHVQNRGFVMMRHAGWAGGRTPAQLGKNQWIEMHPAPPAGACRFLDGRGCHTSALDFVSLNPIVPPIYGGDFARRARDAGRWDDWRAFWYDEAAPVVGPAFSLLTIAAPLRDYLPWLQAWTQATSTRAPETTLLDALLYVVYYNNRQIQAYGQERFVREVLGGTEDVRQQQLQGANWISFIGTGAQALAPVVGAVIAGPGGAQAASTIGGAIAQVAAVAQHFFAENDILRGRVEGHYKDDLGRWKPTFERSSLSGNPAQSMAEGGAPKFEVPDPPGGVVRRSPECPPDSGPVGLPAGTPQIARRSGAGSSLPLLLLGGLVVGGIVLYAASRRSARRGARRANPARRRRRR